MYVFVLVWFLLILLDLKDKAPEEGLLGQVIIEFIILIAVPPVSSLRLHEVVHFYQHCTRASDAPYIAIVKLFPQICEKWHLSLVFIFISPYYKWSPSFHILESDTFFTFSVIFYFLN